MDLVRIHLSLTSSRTVRPHIREALYQIKVRETATVEPKKVRGRNVGHGTHVDHVGDGVPAVTEGDVSLLPETVRTVEWNQVY